MNVYLNIMLKIFHAFVKVLFEVYYLKFPFSFVIGFGLNHRIAPIKVESVELIAKVFYPTDYIGIILVYW